ncbi:MAG TPA: START domain-containing protein [Saprospiraceae bacterium]|nr:START domain-containing protein [Saprospiraceae bacterium]
MRLSGYLALLLCLLLCSGTLPAIPGLHEGWKLESDMAGVKVYSRAIDGSQFRQIKATTAVNAPFETVIAILTDYVNYKLWMNNITDSQIIEQEADTVHYVYAYEDTPWPVQNRFCVSKMKLVQQEDIAMLHFESVPRYMKSPRDAIEFARHKGYWKISRNKTGCEIEYLLESNPGGHVPSWLVNQISYGGPVKTMQNLRSLAEHKTRP